MFAYARPEATRPSHQLQRAHFVWMPSGKTAKRRRAAQRARTQVPAPRTSGRGKASPKVLLAGAGALVLVVAAILLGVALTREDDEPQPAATPTTRLPEAGQVARLFRGIPQSGRVLGDPSAAVTMVEYLDLQCPFCRQFVSDAFPTLVDKHVRTGKLRVELRGLSFIGPDSERGMNAAQAAGLQNRMYQFVDLIYHQQGAENSGWLSDELIETAARSIAGLDVERLLDDAKSTVVAEKLIADSAQAERDGVEGTPTILVGPTGGNLSQVPLSSATDLDSIEQAIAAAGR
jgi:protein-disulfide isomerase